ncbi:MAG: hypothetical protein WCP34_17220 [Pseudomonadota bacterium]
MTRAASFQRSDWIGLALCGWMASALGGEMHVPPVLLTAGTGHPCAVNMAPPSCWLANLAPLLALASPDGFLSALAKLDDSLQPVILAGPVWRVMAAKEGVTVTGDRVRIQITATSPAAVAVLEETLRAAGGERVTHFESVLFALLPPAALLPLVARPEVLRMMATRVTVRLPR